MKPTHTHFWPLKNNLLVGLGTYLATWILLFYLDSFLNIANLALILVLLSVIASLWQTVWMAIVANIASMLLFNWLFVSPRYTFHVSLDQDQILLMTLLGVNFVVTYVMAQLRSSLQLQNQYAETLEKLADWAEQVRAESEVLKQAQELKKIIQNLCNVTIQMMIIEQGFVIARKTNQYIWINENQQEDPTSIIEKSNQAQLAEHLAEQEKTLSGMLVCMQHFRYMGPFAVPKIQQNSYYFPIRGRSCCYGAIAFNIANSQVINLQLAQTIQHACDILGLEIDRSEMQRTAQEAKINIQNQHLRNIFLTSISHDYRTPLANLMSAASIIHDQGAQIGIQNIKKNAEVILKQAQHLSQMTSNVLQLARLDSPAVQVQMDWESLEEILASVIAKIRQNYPFRLLNIHVPNQLPLIFCNSILMLQMFENIFLNAIIYSPENSPIDLVVEQTADSLIVQIKDQGVGIADELKEKVFQAFERGNSFLLADKLESIYQVSPRRGIGVGLALCRAVAKVHKAKLFIRDNLPQGSILQFEWQIQQQPIW